MIPDKDWTYWLRTVNLLRLLLMNTSPKSQPKPLGARTCATPIQSKPADGACAVSESIEAGVAQNVGWVLRRLNLGLRICFLQRIPNALL